MKLTLLSKFYIVFIHTARLPTYLLPEYSIFISNMLIILHIRCQDGSTRALRLIFLMDYERNEQFCCDSVSRKKKHPKRDSVSHASETVVHCIS